MFRNPVFDLFVVVPALLIAGLLSFIIMTGTARAATTTPRGGVETASTSGSTLPDPDQELIFISRAARATSTEATTTPLQVKDTDELTTYGYQVLREDPRIESITLGSRKVTVAYESAGRLLGLMPLALPTTATVFQDGSVSFSAPWYGAVTLAERDRMRSALEVRVRTLLSSEGYLSSMRLAPATQAEILEIIEELVG